MQNDDGRLFLKDVLKLRYEPSDSTVKGDTINGLGMSFDICRHLNPRHYAATSVDRLVPTAGAICAMLYADGTSAAVGYQGDYNAFTMGFPLECITSPEIRNTIMRGILNYIIK